MGINARLTANGRVIKNYENNPTDAEIRKDIVGFVKSNPDFRGDIETLRAGSTVAMMGTDGKPIIERGVMHTTSITKVNSYISKLYNKYR